MFLVTFAFFDMNCNNTLEYEDLILLFKCFMIGYGRLTKMDLPPIKTLDWYIR